MDKPWHVAQVHRNICAAQHCPHIDEIDYLDPCVGCPAGHFKRYMHRGCEKPEPRIKSSFQENTPPLPTKSFSPGDLFSRVIYAVTKQRTTNCGPCGRRKRQMNEWGWWGCWKERKTIIGWLCEEATKRGHPIDRAALWPLFKAAFKELNADAKAYSKGVVGAQTADQNQKLSA